MIYNIPFNNENINVKFSLEYEAYPYIYKLTINGDSSYIIGSPVASCGHYSFNGIQKFTTNKENFEGLITVLRYFRKNATFLRLQKDYFICLMQEDHYNQYKENFQDYIINIAEPHTNNQSGKRVIVLTLSIANESN